MQSKSSQPKWSLLISLFMAGFFLVACDSQQPSDGEMSAESQALIENFIKMWDSGNGDMAAELVTEDFVRTAPDGTLEGANALKEAVNGLEPTFPDFSVVLNGTARNGDVYFASWSMKGTNTGPLNMGDTQLPATGKAFQSEGLSRFEIMEGKISKELVIWDQLGAFSQLGFQLIPPETEEEEDEEESDSE